MLITAASSVGFLARGAMPASKTVMPSPIDGVSDAAWSAFAQAMKTGEPSDVSPSNGLGMFEMRYLRLADLGLVECVVSSRKNGRMVHEGQFVAPLTRERFLADAAVQYAAFVASMKAFVDDVRSGVLIPPDGMSLSGALAVLHRSGRGGLKGAMFSDTAALYEHAKGLF